MSPHLNPAETAELKAHHLACGHLIKGCQDAAIRLRRERADQLKLDEHQSAIDYRAIEILEDILGTWCETLALLRANLNQSSPGDPTVWRWPAQLPNDFPGEMTESSQVAEGRGV